MTIFLNGLWQGALLAAAIWLLLRLTPRLNAATRYVVWWATLLAVLGLPLRALWTNSPAEMDRFSTTADASDASQAIFHRVAVPLSKIVPAQIARANTPGVRGILVDNTPARGPVGSWHWAPIPLAAGPVGVVIGGIWILASAGLLIRLARGYQSLTRIKARASEAPALLQARLCQMKRRSAVDRAAKLLVSEDVATPMVLGLANPAIIIPRSLAEGMSPSDFDHIALHELAHLRRYDDWTNLLQKVIEALLPIQPAVILIGRWMAPEREAACDDWVIGLTGTRKPYAASLARIAEMTLGARCGVLATGAIGHRSQLYRRVQRLLDRRQNARPRILAVNALLWVVAVIVLAAAAMHTPPMIALAEAAPELDAASTMQPSTQPTIQPADGLVTNWVGPLEFTQTQVFAVRAGDKLTVDVDLGNVHVSTWNQNIVRVLVRTKGPDVVDFLKHHVVTINQQGSQVSLTATENSWHSWTSPQVHIDYEIQAPMKFDADLNDHAGNMDISDLDGTVIANADAGNVRLQNTAGKFTVHTAAGNVQLKNTRGALTVHADAGNVDAARCAGILDVTTAAGNLGISGFAGDSIQARSAMGNVMADLISQPKADCSFQTGMGNVTIKLAKSAAVTLSPSTGMGRVESQTGPINGGGPLLQLKTGMGNVQTIRQ
jgi:beta-lactamase regulating signal transducer with metallopeptidase domain